MVLMILGVLAAAAKGQTVGCGGIGGTIRTQNVTIPQRGGGAALQAKIFAPDASLQTGPCPAISILPGGGGSPISTVEWAALRLAASGYVVIAVKPQLPNSVNSYDNAGRSGIDFVASVANPYLSSTDPSVIGVAGWSLGAFASSITQDEDPRVKAYVGWDTLVMSETGDAGTANCTGAPTTVRIPRVPAMGQASETCNDGRSADAKKTAYEHWRSANMPAMQVVLKGFDHFAWSDSGTELQHELSHLYTKNWFDRWLKQDQAAAFNLTNRSLNGVLSTIFRSAAFVDGYNCGNLVASCQAPSALSAGQNVTGTLQSGDSLTTTSSLYDTYTFYGLAGQMISIRLDSKQFDAALTIYKGSFPGGTLLAQDNNGGGGTNARIPAGSGFLTLPETGIYTILAGSNSPGETGSYSIALTTANVRSVVSGRVLNPSGQAVRNAVVTLTDPFGLQRRATTSSFGVYTFNDVPVDSYVVGVTSKRYRFTPRSLIVTGNLTGIDFVGLE